MPEGPVREQNVFGLTIRFSFDLQFRPTIAEYRPSGPGDLRLPGIIEAEEGIAVRAGERRPSSGPE